MGFYIPIVKFYLEHPVRFRFKSLDLIVSLNAESQGRSLARSVRNQGRVEISIFTLGPNIKLFSSQLTEPLGHIVLQ